MRPEIPDELAERIDRVADQEGYTSRGEFVRDAVRQRLQNITPQAEIGELYNRHQINEQNGVEFCYHPTTGDPHIVNRFSPSRNVLIAGNIGSGKTVTSKQLIRKELSRDDDVEVLLLNVLSEYDEFVREQNGTQIYAGKEVCINPLEIVESMDDNVDNYSSKVNMVIESFKTYFAETERELAGTELSILEKAVEVTYSKCGISHDPETHSKQSPTIDDLLDVLRAMATQPSEYATSQSATEVDQIQQAASTLIVSFQQFVDDGEHTQFNGQTELELSGTAFKQIKIEPSSSEIPTFTVQTLYDHLFEYAKTQPHKVIIVLDEAHVLLDSSIASKSLLEQSLRHSRHYNTSIQLVTQSFDPGDFDLLEIALRHCHIRVLHLLSEIPMEVAQILNLSHIEQQFLQNATVGDARSGFSEALLQTGQLSSPVHIVPDEEVLR